MAKRENKKRTIRRTKEDEKLEIIGESTKIKKTKKISKKKKNKRPYGRKEKIFIITSFVIAIGIFLYYGYRSLKYYSKETATKKSQVVTIASAIINNNKITKEQNGFRAIKNGYYFSGKVENNYLKIFNRLYRIVDVIDNKVKIISADNEATFVYGNDNDYKNSNINNWLNKTEQEHTGIYYNTIPNVEKLLDKTEYCAGTLKDNKVTCNDKKETAYFTILTIDDYIRAYGKNSYLNNGKYSFLLGYDEDGNPLVKNDQGSVDGVTNTEGFGVRVVMTLKKNVRIAGGSGTKEDPYVINQMGNDNKINRYVKLGEDKFQIIEENNDIIRLRKTDYLVYKGVQALQQFNKNEAVFSTKNVNNIGYFLNRLYYPTLTYKDILSDCTFNIGEISTETSFSYLETYKDVATVKVGLMNMYDLNNDVVNSDYYLINTTSNIGSMVKTYNSLGIIDDDKAREKKKIIPVVCIDKKLIKSGDGSDSNPYKVE